MPVSLWFLFFSLAPRWRGKCYPGTVLSNLSSIASILLSKFSYLFQSVLYKDNAFERKINVQSMAKEIWVTVGFPSPMEWLVTGAWKQPFPSLLPQDTFCLCYAWIFEVSFLMTFFHFIILEWDVNDSTSTNVAPRLNFLLKCEWLTEILFSDSKSQWDSWERSCEGGVGYPEEWRECSMEQVDWTGEKQTSFFNVKFGSS